MWWNFFKLEKSYFLCGQGFLKLKMVIDCKRNAGSKKNLSLARFWLNSEIGIHQMFSNALSESANTFTCSRIIHSQSRENCSRMIFCIMEGFFNQDHLEYWCICRQTETLGRLNKLDKLQIWISDFVCAISKQHMYWFDAGL